MAKGYRKDKVTVTFHYLARQNSDDAGEPKPDPFTRDEFGAAMAALAALPKIDTTTQAGVDKLRFASTVPIEQVTKLAPNLYFGMYKGVYTGHSYENTAKGVIPHDSASLRAFYFLAYWSAPKGRVYIATQYLGQFGDYTGLKNTIIRAFVKRKGIDSYTFRNLATAFQNVKAKEITIEYAKKGKNAGVANDFGATTSVVLKRSGDGANFISAARKKLFTVWGKPVDKIRAAAAKILREDELITVKDGDIVNCTVLAEVDGLERRYHFINEANFATPFPVTVGMTADGHPAAAQLQVAMRNMLKAQIIDKAENV